MCQSMLNYGENIQSQFYSNQEKTAICQTVVSAIKAYHSNGDYDGMNLEFWFRGELYSALYAAMDNDAQKTIAYLENAREAFKKLDTISATALQRPYTSPFLCELSAPLGCRKEDYRKLFGWIIENNAFDNLRNEDNFQEIERGILCQ